MYEISYVAAHAATSDSEPRALLSNSTPVWDLCQNVKLWPARGPYYPALSK